MTGNVILRAGPITTPSLYKTSRQGRTAYPVSPFFSINARFKHIIGVPSRNAAEQIPISKLRILDNLIDRLTRLRKKDTDSAALQNLSEEEIDPLIKQLESELRNELMAQKPSFSGLYPETGMLFSMHA